MGSGFPQTIASKVSLDQAFSAIAVWAWAQCAAKLWIEEWLYKQMPKWDFKIGNVIKVSLGTQSEDNVGSVKAL